MRFGLSNSRSFFSLVDSRSSRVASSRLVIISRALSRSCMFAEAARVCAVLRPPGPLGSRLFLGVLPAPEFIPACPNVF